jgi:glycosyltransferase involved in cell wall biosynthesis
MKLSVVIPVYNEAATLREIVQRVVAADAGMPKELVLIDDGSSDGTRRILEAFQAEHPGWKCIYHDRNRGKGAALRSGFAAATGEIILIQDADLEYDPAEYPHLLAPILKGLADVVYGSRFFGGGPHRVMFYWHYVGNRMLTTLSNMLTNLNLNDMEVCYKVFRREVLEKLTLKEERFGFEVEITAKVARAGWRVYEVPISYYGRGYEEGKKITWRDGVRALWCILKYRLMS